MPNAPSKKSKAKSAAGCSISDDAIAQDFANHNIDAFAYLMGQSLWLQWNGQRWCNDGKGSATEAVRRFCRKHASYQADPRVADRLRSLQKIRAVEKLAQSDPKLSRDPASFDRDPLLLNTPEGVIELRDGSSDPHDASLMLRHMTNYVPDRDCSAWLAYLKRVTGNDLELISYLQRVAGYCLTGSVQEQALFILLGDGANGKSVFTNVLIKIWGSYALAAPPHLFSASRQERHPTELASLVGSRLVVVAELEHCIQLASNRVKHLTGGDRISARWMNKDFFEFDPTFKFVMTANDVPPIGKLDPATRRRIQIVPFDVTLAPAEQDHGLTEKLLIEGNGILGWAVEGAIEWQRMGLCPPARVLECSKQPRPGSTNLIPSPVS